jgi:hypothetical protein
MSHTPLGQVCLSLGLMRAEDVERVLGRLREGASARFGEIAVELGLLDDDGLTRALAQQFRLNMVPPDRLARLSVTPEVLELLPAGLIRERLLVPTFLDEEKRVLSLLTADPTDIPSLRAAQTAARAARIRLFVASKSAMRGLIDRLLPADELEPRVVDRATVLADESNARGLTVVFEPDPDRAAAVRRLESIEGGHTEVVGDPEQVSAFIEANRADRVFFRRAVLLAVEPYLAAWRRLRPQVYICALDGYGPGHRLAVPYDRTRDFFFGLLRELLADAHTAPSAVRTVELAREMAAQAGLAAEQRDAVTLVAMFWCFAAEQGEERTDAAALAEAAQVLQRADPPYDVQGVCAALTPRVQGEAGPGDHPGAEILYTARWASRLASAPIDPIAALGGDATRHDGAALQALAAALRRDALRGGVYEEPDRAPSGEEPRSDLVDTPKSASPAPSEEGATGTLMGALRRVLGRTPGSSPAVTGRLSELSLVELLQTLTLGGRTARVQVLGSAERGVVQVREGRLVAANHGARVGEPALHSLVALREGRFEVRFEDDAVTNLSGSSELLLLEALRRKDEQRVR